MSIYLRDVSLSQVVRKHAAEMVQTGLAGAIGECLKRRHSETVNATNVDDTGGVIWSRRLLQKRSHKLGQVEDTVQVQRKDTSEGGGGILVVGSTPVGTGVVDQDVEL